jgi:4-amino-4-deoxy-L-arabinose transferase-like glycosyltransferase
VHGRDGVTAGGTTRSHGAGIALTAAVAAGVAATAHGWFRAPAGTWRTGDHLQLLAAVAGLLLVLTLVTRRRACVTPTQCMIPLAAFAAAASAALGALVAMLLIAWSAVVFGRLLLTRFGAVNDRDALLAGLAAFGTIVGILVHWPINHGYVYCALVATPLLVGRRHALEFAGRVLAWCCSERTDGLASIALQLAVAAVASLHVLAALMPEIGFDALAMHLLVPLRVVRDHVWQFDFGNYVWALMPMLVDWVYTLACMLGGEASARLVNAGATLLLAKLVHDLARWAGAGDLAARAAALLFLSTPLALSESGSLFIDSLWTCLLLGGAMALLRALVRGEGVEPRAGDVVVAGITLGGALAAKAVTMMVLPVLGIVALAGARRWPWRRLAGAAAVAAMAAVAIGAVPYAYAWIASGNPVFPFFNGVFRSPHYPTSDFEAAAFGRGVTWDVLHAITFDTSRYLEALPGAAGFQWLLLVAPIAVAGVIARSGRVLLLLAIAAAAGWLTFQQTAYLRYVLPTFALAAAAVGGAFASAAAGGRVPRLALALAVALAVALNLRCLASGGVFTTIVPKVLFQATARDRHVAAHAPMRPLAVAANALGAPGAPVAVFGAPLTADLHDDALAPSWHNWRYQGEVQEAVAAPHADAIGDLLARRGARLLVLADGWGDERARQRIRDASHELLSLPPLSLRRLDDRFSFRRELLAEPGFAAASAWSVAAPATIEPGRGAVIAPPGAVSQHVAVAPARPHRLVARLRRIDATAATHVRLQLDWHRADGSVTRRDLEVRACGADSTELRLDAVAPRDATAVTVHVVGFDAAARLEQLSLRD